MREAGSPGVRVLAGNSPQHSTVCITREKGLQAQVVLVGTWCEEDPASNSTLIDAFAAVSCVYPTRLDDFSRQFVFV